MQYSSSMKEHVSGEVVYYSFPLLDPWPALTQAVFARRGGVSAPPYDSLNLSFAVQDDPARVSANFERACRAVGWSPSQVASVRQLHGREVVSPEPACKSGRLLGADGVVTDRPGVLLLLRFADCVPVIIWDPVRRVVGMAHAGWKGTLLGTPAAVVERMKEQYGCRPADLLAAIGPSIGPCCYQIGPDVAGMAAQVFPGTGVLRGDAGGSMRLDLWSANAETLMRAGVGEENLAVAGVCTRCHHDIFFSHRAAGGLTGRFGVVAGILDE